MPIIKSAKKRARVAAKATIRNRKTKRSLKEAVKAFISKSSNDSLSRAQSEIDKAVKKGVMHKNKAARKKSQLAKVAKEAKVRPTKKATAKTAVKKAASTTAKKPAAKKPTTKKAAK